MGKPLPPAIVDEIIWLWNLGQSAGVVGKAVDMSKNSVIGIVHRARIKGIYVRTSQTHVEGSMKRPRSLKWRKEPSVPVLPLKPKKKPRKRPSRAKAATVALDPDTPALPQILDAKYGQYRLWELPAKGCRWSDSNGRARTYLFCGKPGFPWCPEHHKRVYTKARPERRLSLEEIVKIRNARSRYVA